MTRPVAFPFDIILTQLKLFCFSGQLADFSKGTRTVDGLYFNATKFHS
jgi:hypothetical protein